MTDHEGSDRPTNKNVHPAAHAAPTPGPVRELGVTIERMTQGLLWPKLLRAAGLGLRPHRLLPCWALLLVVWVAAMAAGIVATPRGLWDLPPASATLTGPGLELRIGGLSVDAGNEWLARAIALVAAVLFVLLGTGLARSAAWELCFGRGLGFGGSLGYARRRAASSLVLLVMPLVIGSLLGLIPLVLLAVPAAIPGLDIVASVLLGPAFVLLLPVAAVLLLTLAGLPLLPAALACEDTDGMDAVQRVFGYLVGRPARALAYAITLVIIIGLSSLAIGLLIEQAIRLAEWLANLMTADRQWPDGDVPARIAASWIGALRLLVPAYALSTLISGAPVVYLLLRRANDGTDFYELWSGREGSDPPEADGAETKADSQD